MYYLLTERFKEQEEKLVAIIKEACSPVKIFLLGSTLVSRRTESVFMPDAPTCSNVGHYYVLVIVNNNKGHNEMQDKIENRCSNFIPTTAIILSEVQFNKWIIGSHAFARTVYERVVILYGKKIKPSFSINDNAAIENENNKICACGINTAEAFLAGAELYRLRKQNNMAAFMLHQAMEQTLIVLLRLKTGLRVNTHNLNKLYRYSCMVCYKLPEIIFGSNNRNNQLFYLLQKAYVEARYNSDYKISTFDVEAGEEMVKRLYGLLGTLEPVKAVAAYGHDKE